MKTKKKIGPKLEKPIRLPDQVAARLVSRIREGVFKPGEMLPSEANLAEQFGVSRTVIREALSRLKYDGLLDSQPGIGAKVADNSRKRVFRLDDIQQTSDRDIEHLFELRAILEGDAAFLAATRRSSEQVEQLNECLRQMEKAIKENSDGTAPDAKFHSIISEASSNPYLNELMQLLNDNFVNLIRKARRHVYTNPDLRPIKLQQEHEAIYRAIVDRSPLEARSAALIHVKNAGGRLGFKIKTTII